MRVGRFNRGRCSSDPKLPGKRGRRRAPVHFEALPNARAGTGSSTARLHEGPSARGSAELHRRSRRPIVVGATQEDPTRLASLASPFANHHRFRRPFLSSPLSVIHHTRPRFASVSFMRPCAVRTMELLRPFMDRTTYSRARRASHAAAVDVTSTTSLEACLWNGLPALPLHFWISKTAAASANS